MKSRKRERPNKLKKSAAKAKMLQLVGWVDKDVCFCFCLKKATKFHCLVSFFFLPLSLSFDLKGELVLDFSYFFYLSFCLSVSLGIGVFFSFTEGVSHILAGTLSLFALSLFFSPFLCKSPSLSFFLHPLQISR